MFRVAVVAFGRVNLGNVRDGRDRWLAGKFCRFLCYDRVDGF